MLMHQEMIELKETIDTINTDLSVRDEEVLKMRIKIRQVDMEREKLEAELQILKKLLGKQSRGKNAQ